MIETFGLYGSSLPWILQGREGPSLAYVPGSKIDLHLVDIPVVPFGIVQTPSIHASGYQFQPTVESMEVPVVQPCPSPTFEMMDTPVVHSDVLLQSDSRVLTGQ